MIPTPKQQGVLIALALTEAASARIRSGTPHSELLLAIAKAIHERGRCYAQEEEESWAKLVGRTLRVIRDYAGSFEPRADYLMCGLAERQPDWHEPLKRRQEWLSAAYRGKVSWKEIVRMVEREGGATEGGGES